MELRKELFKEEAELHRPDSGQSDVRVPQKPEPKALLQPVTLHGVHGSSASGTSSGVAPPGPLGSGSLRPPSDIHKVGMQALAQGAWSASMALLDGKQPCQSPEQAALENTQRWLDEAASKAKAERARQPQDRPANALREEIAQLEAQKAKLHEEAKEKTAALAAEAKAQQEVTECEEVEAAQKAGFRPRALKQQMSRETQFEEEIGAAETQAMGAAEAEAEAQKAMAQAEERRRMELQAERKEKEEEVEEFRALQFEVESLRESQVQRQKAEAEAEVAQAEEKSKLQAKLEEETKVEEMRQAEALQALKSEVQGLRDLQKREMQEQQEQEQQNQELLQRLRDETSTLRQQLERNEQVQNGEEEEDEEEEDREGDDSGRKRPRTSYG